MVVELHACRGRGWRRRENKGEWTANELSPHLYRLGSICKFLKVEDLIETLKLG